MDKSKACILLIEDNNQLRELLADILREDYQVIQASDGEEGVEKAFLNLPDLIVTDLMMPRMNGYEVARRVKGHSKTATIPVIILTALNEENDMIKGWETGADHYYTKPIKAREFLARIRNILDGRRNLVNNLVSRDSFSFNKENPFKDPWLENLDSFILTHVSNIELKIEEIAQHMKVTHAQFERRMKKLTGLTPVAYLRRYRLLYATSLLRANAHNVSEVSFLSGFSNPAYFGKCFREEFNMTPKKYQLNHLEGKGDILSQES